MPKLKKYLGSKNYLLKHYRRLGNMENDFRNYNLIKLIASKVKGNAVLDIGCGSGLLIEVLSKMGVRVFGIEPNKELIKLAKDTNPELYIINGYAEDIDTFKQKIDTITIIDVLEHIENDNLQIQKIYTKLDNGGSLIIVVPAFQFLYGKRDENLGHYRRYSKKELIQKVSKAGFKIASIRYWNMLGFFPYIFYEKIINKELNTELRSGKEKGIGKNLIAKMLNFWFRHIENNINFNFGLSLICIAEKRLKS